MCSATSARQYHLVWFFISGRSFASLVLVGNLCSDRSASSLAKTQHPTARFDGGDANMPDAADDQAARAAAQAIVQEAEAQARAFSDEDLLEALTAMDIEQSQTRLAGAVQDAIRLRASQESAFPVGGKQFQISKGELLAFLWVYFQEYYGPPRGEVALFVAQMRANWEARVAEAVRRGLIDSPRASRARTARETSSRRARGAG